MRMKEVIVRRCFDTKRKEILCNLLLPKINTKSKFG